MKDKFCLELKTGLPIPVLQVQNNDQCQGQCEIKEFETPDLVDPDSLTYEIFFENYLIQNRPCVLTEKLTRDWNSRKEWTKYNNEEHSKLEINFEILSLKYGNQKVNVTNCNEALGEYNDTSNCQTMTVDAFITYWKDYREKDYPSSMECLYLKDWHIMKNWNEPESRPYITPIYFASDWLNESCEEKEDDFKFVYMGPKGSRTPFHCDVYGSFSWSANIIGTKKWHLYPPGKEVIFKNLKSGRIDYDFNNPGLRDEDYYEIIQESGQVIFVPSGWFHTVWNLEDTLSINHNWMNGTNINFIWKNLRTALDDVEKELDDLKDVEDFSEICQGLLKANHGMNYSGFRDILLKILQDRRKPTYTVDGCYYFGENHIQFDIEACEIGLYLLGQDKRFF